MKFSPYPRYKDSGIDWLGEIPQHWEQLRLSWLFRRSKTINRPDAELLSIYRDYGVIPKSSRDDNFNKPSDDLSTYQLVEVGDLVLNKMKTWQGSIAISEFEGIVSPAYFVAKPQREFILRFVHYLLRSPVYISQYLRYSKGIRPNQWDLDFADFRKLPAILPPIEEQNAIAEFLDVETLKIDELIGKQERLIALLQEKRQALISHAVTKGLNPDTPMKDSCIEWLGKVPASWKPYKLGMLAAYFSGATPSKDNLRYWDGGIPWVTPKDMKRRYIDSSEDTISDAALQETNLILFQPPILLIVVRGMILVHTLPVAVTTAPVTINQDMKALKLVGWLNIEFFAYFLKGLSSAILSLLVEESAHGTKVIRMDGWKHFLVFLPEVSEQSEIKNWIDTQLAKLNSLINKAQQQIELLQEHRTALIFSAVTGKIDVRHNSNGNLSNH